MSNFDWIQWYLIVIVCLNISIGMFMHGEDYKIDFRVTFTAMVLMLPIYGRILGLW